MELFKRRYLCFIAFIFILVSFISYSFAGSLKLIAIIALFAALIGAVLLFALYRKRRFTFLIVLISVATALSAVAHSFLFVSIPAYKAKQYKGEFAAELEIISLEYSDGESSEYTVRLTEAKGEAPNIKAYLVCDFPTDLNCGDRIIALVDSEDVEPKGYSIGKDILLMLSCDASQPILYAEAEEYPAFSIDGIKNKASELRAAFGRYVDGIFGDSSALVKGMLVNDKSGMSVYTKTQFSRAGAAHLLAVSGLHVSLLLGALELLLKKLLAPKPLRIALLSVAGVVLLALTDFSPSAVRSVLMLIAVYVNYLFSEESDAPTSLFVAVALIILFSPFSVTDIGMWLSFLATLGLVTVYPVFERKIPYIEKSRKLSRKLLRFGTSVLKAALITVVANIFTLPVMWYCFGSVSLSSLPCNLILTPLVAVFMPIAVLALIFGKVALLGNALVFMTNCASSLILGTVSAFADIRGATLSLEYPFVPPLIITFAVSMSVLMLIKLRKKLFIALPPIALAVSFAIALGVFALTDKTEIKYVGWGENELFFIEKAGVSSVCDISSGRASAYNLLIAETCEYSAEIENYVITHPHAQHPTMLRRLYENKIVRKLYLPLIENAETLSVLKEIYDVASGYNTEIIFYKNGETIPLSSEIDIIPCFIESGNGVEVFLKLVGEDDIITYTDRAENDLAFALGEESRYFLFGAHGKTSTEDEPITLDGVQKMIFATKSVSEESRVSKNGISVYVMSEKGEKRELVITP